MTSSVNTAFSVMSFLSFILVVIPFPWHLQAWNTGTCFYMLWVSLGNLIYFIDSIVWRNDSINKAPVWCDIVAKFQVGANVAVLATSLCINRRLYLIATVSSVTRTKRERLRSVMTDVCICLLLPMILMALHYIPQGHRFDIYEEFGCAYTVYNTWVAVLLVQLPPLLIALVSLTYSVRTIIAFRRRAVECRNVLGSNSITNHNRYFRLMALASIDAIFGVPMALFILITSIQPRLFPWISWADTHYNFSHVLRTSAALWRQVPIAVTRLESTRWIMVACGLVFFAMFGFADEAMRRYSSIVSTITKRVGYSSTGSSTLQGKSDFTISNSFKKSTGPISSMNSRTPVMVSQHTVEKRDSLDSFSDLTSLNDGASLDHSIRSESQSSTFKQQVAVETNVVLKDTIALEVSRRPPSDFFPSSVTPSTSYLDLNDSKKGYHNSADNNV